METWIRWNLTTPRENADICAQLLLDAGCTGVQVDDCTVLFDESEDATLVPKADATVIGYFSSQDEATEVGEKLEAALQRARITARWEAEVVPEQDWANAWREHFPPLRIGPFLIVPSWEEINEESTREEGLEPKPILLRLDPGLAFGTGQHPTTRLCLELLAQHLNGAATNDDRPVSPRVLDVGCGSGILSIAAAQLGAHVTASDLDPWCTRATRDNAAINGISIQVVQAAGLDWLKVQFDVIAANLMSALLVSLAPQLAAATRDGGILIVSGISAPRAAEVEGVLCAAGFKTIEKREADGEQREDFIERWTAFVMQKEKEGAG